MKKAQRINESQLRAIVTESVKRALNELDWKTYRNASRYPNKEGNPSYGGRKDRFADAARREFNNKYGFQTSRARFGCGSFTGNVMCPKLEINPYAKVETNYAPFGTWYPVRKEKDGYYLEKNTQHNVNDNYSRINLSDYMTDEEIMRYEDGMRDWKHYVANDNDKTFTLSNNGNYDYDNDKGWSLSSVVNESVKKVLKESHNQEQIINDAVEALMSVREIVDRASNCWEYEDVNAPLFQQICNASAAITAVWGFSKYGADYRTQCEREMHEQD